jgi:CRISPR system Cascade subunit CasE
MDDLHLWRLVVDAAALADLAHTQRIPTDDQDHGYALHALLCGLFGKTGAPKPWFHQAEKGWLWAYAPHPLDLTALPITDRHRQVVVTEGSRSKPMPAFRVGQHLAFDLRACPVVRHGKGPEGKASEHDALIWHARRKGVEPSHLDPRLVYAAWLREQAWKPTFGADLEDAQVAGWLRPHRGERTGPSTVWRGRGDGRLRLPEVRFTGRLTITDPVAFRLALARGVGRHRAFGFGMLLVRPAVG